VRSNQDITERKQAEQELRESEARFRTLAESSPLAIFVNREDKVVLANPAAAKLFGTSSPDQLIGRSALDLFDPASRSLVRERIRVDSEEVPLVEVRILRLDGTSVDVEATASPFLDQGVKAIQVLLRDITERKQAEQELRESEARYRALAERSPLTIFVSRNKKDNDEILLVNEACLKLFGASSPEELVGRSAMDLFHPDSRAHVRKPIRKGTSRTIPFIEAQIVRLDGTPVDVDVSAAPLLGQGLPAVQVVLRDITERKEAERARLRAQKFFRDTFEHADVGIAHVNSTDGTYLRVNPRLCDMVGYSREELLATTFATVTYPDDVEKNVAPFQRMLAGEQSGHACDTRYLRKDGSIVWVHLNIVPIRKEDGTPDYNLAVITDISERKQAEDEIQRLNTGLEERVQERTEELSATNLKLEEATRAKSDFLASMSHELRTPLNSIIGFSGIMLQGLAGDLNEEQSKQLGMINNSGQHLLELINEVLDLTKIESGQDRPTIRKVRVGAVAREMFDTVGPMAEAKGIDMRWTCPEGLRLIRTDKFRVGQILLNLMGNAVKFTEHGYVSVAVSQDGSGVVIAVKDSGCGIATEDLERVFDDFYQVSPHVSAKSEGTGLGLTVSRRLAESIGARIEVTSEPARGSAFTLHIPERSRERDLPVGQSRIEF
jgi:PAS domain S-box-containing protein